MPKKLELFKQSVRTFFSVNFPKKNNRSNMKNKQYFNCLDMTMNIINQLK